jgi:HD superfamily phosphohydrolase
MERRIRDPVHGFILMEDTECELVNTSVFRRLKGIHQLALAHELYPGARHTRFEHSLGVYHIAGQMCAALRIEGEDAQRVKHAALLHDIGHGPFSHVSETLLDRYGEAEKVEEEGLSESLAEDREEIHELVTVDIVRGHPELQAVKGWRSDEVASLIEEGYGDPVLHDIISGPLDADKQDYLLRDSLMCGVRYGVFDPDQLQRSLTTATSGRERTLAVVADGVHAIEQFLLAKYYITRQVYMHRVRQITDQMLIRAISLGIDADEIDELQSIYAYDGSEDFIDRYTQWDDARILRHFSDSNYEGKYSQRLLSNLQKRILNKRVFEIEDIEQEFEDPVVREALLSIADGKGSDDLRAEIESEAAAIIAEEFCQNVDPLEVICHGYKMKSARSAGGDATGGILLVDEEGGTEEFHESSTLFQSMDKSMSEPKLAIYAPVSYQTNAEKRRHLSAIRDDLQQMIASTASRAQEGEDEDEGT